MRTFLASLLLVLLPADAFAFSIRSGEHEGFSRLVIQFDGPPNWSLEINDTGYVLRADDIPRGQDFSQVFRLIPRTRLSEIRQDDGTGNLLFDLACDCHAETLELDRNRLVVDFKPGPDPNLASVSVVDQSVDPGTAKPTEIPISDGDPATPVSRSQDPPGSPLPAQALRDLADNPATPEDDATAVRNEPDTNPETMVKSPSSALGKPGSGMVSPSGQKTPIEIPAQKAIEPALDHPGSLDEQRAQNIDGFERDLAKTLAKAMTDGLIDTPALPKMDPDVADAEGAQPIADSEPRALTPSPPHHGHSTKTQREIDQTTGEAVAKGATPAKCDGAALPAFLLVDGETYDDLARYRAGIIDASGRILPKGLEQLMRFYLRNGFGTEARQILALPEFSAESASAYLQITYLVEGEPPVDPGILSGQLRCGGNGAIWEVLSSSRIPALTEDMRRAIAKGFLLLSPGMKQAIGPDLTEKLIRNGEVRLATTMLAQIERASRTGALTRIAQAELAMIDEDFEKARTILKTEIAQNSVSAPDALLLLLGELDEIDLDDAELRHMLILADAFAFEHRGTSLETRLKRVTLHRKAQAGDLRSALRSMKNLDLAADDEQQKLVADLLRTGLPKLSDFGLVEFLSRDMHLLSHLETDDPVLTETFLRVGDLGLPGLTTRLLREFPDESDAMRAELQASVALDRRDEARMAAAIGKVSPSSQSTLETRLDIRRRLPEPASGLTGAAADETPARAPPAAISNKTPPEPPSPKPKEATASEPEAAFDGSDTALRNADEILEKLKLELGNTYDAPSS